MVQALAASHLEAGALELEITESLLMADPERALQFSAAIASHGSAHRDRRFQHRLLVAGGA